MDYSYGRYDWPLALFCPGCGNIIKGIINKDGLQPKSLVCDEVSEAEVYVVGYSAELPISDSIFYKKMKTKATIGTLTPFLSLNAFDHNIKRHENNILRLLDGITPWRQFLKIVLPIYLHGNVSAFVNKMQSIFEVDLDWIKTIEDCDQLISQQMGAIYNALTSPNYYAKTPIKKLFADMCDYLKNAAADDKCTIRTAVYAGVDADKWLKKEALEWVADMLENIEKLFPAMFYANNNEFTVPHQQPKYIVTIDYHEANRLYQTGSETLDHILPLVAAILNMMNNGNPDTFTNEKMKGQPSIASFAQLPMGGKQDKLVDYEDMQTFIFGSIDHRIRNGIAHPGGVQYDYQTQMISYKTKGVLQA